MSDTLIDRYVHAAVRTVPPSQRGEVEPEIRELVLESVAAKHAGGTDPARAEHDALVELGDPEALAADYVDRRLELIGPRLFLEWWRLLKVLLVTIVPVVAVILAAVAGFDEARGWDEAIRAGIFGGLNVGVHVIFWTTLVFAILERIGADATYLGAHAWTPDQLPALPSTHAPKLTETVTAVVGLGAAITAIVWQQVASPVLAGDRHVPVLDPDLWGFWLPFLIVTLALQAAVAVVAYRGRRGWTWRLASANAAVQLAFDIPALWLLNDGRLLNAEFFERLGWPEGAEPGSSMAVGITIGVVAVALWDIVDKFWRARERGRSAASAS